jgi:hypothetical protein
MLGYIILGLGAVAAFVAIAAIYGAALGIKDRFSTKG